MPAFLLCLIAGTALFPGDPPPPNYMYMRTRARASVCARVRAHAKSLSFSYVQIIGAETFIAKDFFLNL